MNRRELLYTAGTAGAALAVSDVLLAKGGHKHHEDKNTNLISIASDCVNKGEICLSHCLTELGAGRKDMAECAVSVREMLATCETLVKLAASDSKYLKKMAALCEDVCKNCAEMCKKHAKLHSTCKDCMDSCIECAKACAKVN